MDGYRHQELTDETLEKDIEAALGVDPSPEFLPRIRARIANERMQEGWFSSVSWRWARVAAVVTAVAVIAVWTLRDPSRAPREAHITDTPPVESTPPPVELSAPGTCARRIVCRITKAGERACRPHCAFDAHPGRRGTARGA